MLEANRRATIAKVPLPFPGYTDPKGPTSERFGYGYLDRQLLPAALATLYRPYMLCRSFFQSNLETVLQAHPRPPPQQWNLLCPVLIPRS